MAKKKNSLVNNIIKRKEIGKSRSIANSTISKRGLSGDASYLAQKEVGQKEKSGQYQQKETETPVLIIARLSLLAPTR